MSQIRVELEQVAPTGQWYLMVAAKGCDTQRHYFGSEAEAREAMLRLLDSVKVSPLKEVVSAVTIAGELKIPILDGRFPTLLTLQRLYAAYVTDHLCKGNVADAARTLGVGRTTLHRWRSQAKAVSL